MLEIDINLSKIDESLIYEENGDSMIRAVCFVYDDINRHGTVGMQVQWIPVQDRIKGEKGRLLGYFRPISEDEWE